jgi:hypothetical protein
MRTEHGIVDRPSLVVPCEFCGLKFSTAGLPIHILQQHQQHGQLTEQPPITAPAPEDSSKQKAARRMAKRGRKKQVVEEENERQEEEEEGGMEKEKMMPCPANELELVERSEATIEHLSISGESGERLSKIFITSVHNT